MQSPDDDKEPAVVANQVKQIINGQREGLTNTAWETLASVAQNENYATPLREALARRDPSLGSLANQRALDEVKKIISSPAR
jgi:hypothetical protein